MSRTLVIVILVVLALWLMGRFAPPMDTPGHFLLENILGLVIFVALAWFINRLMVGRRPRD